MAKTAPRTTEARPDEGQAPAAPAAKKTPTAAQLAKLRKGGDYLFNPHSGELVQTRKPTKPEGN